ncbi:MAG: hypothetical protein JST16_03065 [Bdellovibrionales bacterium]|nr:hypothetical protein [Bdellovibrionales bacterium]
MSQFRIHSTRFLESKPTLFGFTPVELTGLVVLMSILSASIPGHPLVTVGVLVAVAGAMLGVRLAIGPSRLVRFFRAITGSGFNGQREGFYSVRVLGPQFSEATFDDEFGYFKRVRDRLCHFPQNIPLVVSFRRVQVDLQTPTREGSDAISILRRERREALCSAGPFFENRVYFSTPKKYQKHLTEFLCDLRLESREEDCPSFSVQGLVSGHIVHGEDQSLHSFELGALPLEFGLRDLSSLLRMPHEVTYTLRLTHKNSRSAIQRYSMKHGSMKGFQGGASSQIEASLSATAAYDTIGQLISGQDGIFAVQGVLTFRTKERALALPQMAFTDSLIPLSHAGVRDLELLHRGARDSILERTLTGIEVAGLLPTPFAWTTPPQFPNFFTPERELLHVSGFQDDLASGNAVCFGPSGKGKSMTLANLFAYILEETDRSVVILDNGHGFDNFVRAYDGQTFEMASSDHPAGISIMKILAQFDDENFRQEALVDFTRFLADPRGHVEPLSMARLRKLAQRADFGAGLSDWAALLRDAGEAQLAELLDPFVRGGIYGEHFDGGSLPEIRSRVLYFTGPMVSPGAEANPLIVPYFFVVNLLIASRLGRDLPPAKICWDELKYLMQCAPDVVTGMWNRVRKTGNSVICAAQHPGQIAAFAGGEDILINSPTGWFLGLPKGESTVDRFIPLTDETKEALASRQPGDFFLLWRDGRMYWASFAQSPLHYALFTSKKSERDRIDRLIADEERSLGRSPKAAVKGAIRYLSERAKSVAVAGVAIACFAVCAGNANASIFGEENAPLYAILAKHIEELAILKQQLDKAASQVNEMRSIYENHKRILEEIKIAASVIKSKDREMGGLNNKAKAIDKILESVAELKSAQRLPRGLEEESQVVGETMAYQNGLVSTSDSTKEAGLVVTRQARSASPGVAAKLSAQAEGLSLQALGDIQRSQAEIIRLMTIEAAERTNNKAQDIALERELRASRGDSRQARASSALAARPF